MKGATLADAAVMNTDILFEQLLAAQKEIQILQIENELLKELLGEN